MPPFNYIPIVFITDESYIVPTCVAVSTVISTKKQDTHLRFYILTNGLSEQNTCILEGFSSNTVKIRIITADISRYAGIHHSVKDSYCQATETALLKFDIPELIPEKKILYLDGDILCRGDLTGLFETALAGNMLGAVMDSGRIYSKRAIVSECPSYFNSGVMLMDLDAMRTCDAGTQLYRIKKAMTQSQLMDQDVFNLFCKDRVQLLPVKYNLLYVNLLRAQRNKKFEMNHFNDLFQTNYRSLSHALTDSVIVHCASKDKPWKTGNAPLRDEWMQAFEQLSETCHSERLPSLQNKWLFCEIRKLHMNLQVLQTENAAFWENECNHIRNSLSYRIGRATTALPRYLRKKLRNHMIPYPMNGQVIVANSEPLHKRSHNLIISLTTHGSRVKTAHIAIKTLLQQTVKPDKIVLCVSESDYARFTPQLKRMEQKGEIEVLKQNQLESPHKKYFFTMQKYPDDIIITVDDDILYRNDLIEKLYAAHMLFPDCITAMRVHRIRFSEDGNIRPYNEWRKCSSEYILQPRNDLLATGVGGVLYPPHLLHNDTFNVNIIEQTCIKADDIWLKVMELLSGVKVVLAAPCQTTKYIRNTQKDGLFNNNVNHGGNDAQIKCLFEHYGREKLIAKIADNY